MATQNKNYKLCDGCIGLGETSSDGHWTYTSHVLPSLLSSHESTANAARTAPAVYTRVHTAGWNSMSASGVELAALHTTRVATSGAGAFCRTTPAIPFHHLPARLPVTASMGRVSSNAQEADTPSSSRSFLPSLNR